MRLRPFHPSLPHLALALVLGAGTAAASESPRADDPPREDPQDKLTVEERLDRLEANNEDLRGENAELKDQVLTLAEEVERSGISELFPQLGETGRYGLGRAASKIYERTDSGLSIGGYGEILFTHFPQDGATDQIDFVRAVIYLGYKFNDDWVLNSEFELEHASTGSGGSFSVEFAYLDRLIREEVNVRVGLVLIPVGFYSEQHEPTAYLPATRPETERRIIPSTWREIGAGVFGEVVGVGYRVYAVNGLDATGFTDAGLRGGRQKGSRAKAEDFAVVARADWIDTPGLLAGGSVYYGNSGQGQTGLGPTPTTIFELHGEWKARGVWARALGSWATVGDVDQLNVANGVGPGESVGERLEGWYVTLGYDVLSPFLPDSGMNLYPYVRYEYIDTQVEVPSGFTSDDSNRDQIWSYGVHFNPISQIVVKLEYQGYERGMDRANVQVGYVF